MSERSGAPTGTTKGDTMQDGTRLATEVRGLTEDVRTLTASVENLADLIRQLVNDRSQPQHLAAQDRDLIR